MLVEKVNPVGIDLAISKIQKSIYDNLILIGWTNYEAYGRAILNPKNKDRIPEIAVGRKEYKEVLFSDKFNATSFFLVDDKREFDAIKSADLFVDASIIFQLKLNKLYPTIPHRADEEANKDCFNSVGKFVKKIEGLTTGLPAVYNSFNVSSERLKLTDMSDFHVLKIDFKIKHSFCNC